MTKNNALLDQFKNNVINRFDEQELEMLNQLIVQRLNQLRTVKSNMAVQQFSVGDEVEFNDKFGQLVRGIVIKINRKTIGMLDQSKKEWRISPEYLRKISS